MRGQSLQLRLLPAVTQAVPFDGAFLGMENDLAGCAIHQDGVALANPGQGVFHSHDGTDVQGARQYGGMSGGAPLFGDDGGHLGRFQKAHLRGREVGREQDACFGRRGVGWASQVSNQALADIAHIGSSLLEPGDVQGLELLSQRQDGATDSVFGGTAVVEDQGFHRIHE